MQRRAFLRQTLAGGIIAATGSTTAWSNPDKPRPSFLVMTFEDISPRLGCYGDPVARTPVLDALAARGYAFTNMMASSPVCAPARCNWITGVYPMALGAGHMRTTILKPDSIPCFTEYLRRAGYYCCNSGKFDYQFNPPDTAWDYSRADAHWKNRPDPNQPFYAVYNYVTTHPGRVQRYDLYQQAGGSLPPGEKTDPAVVRVPAFLPDTPTVRNLIARTYDNITFTEKAMGRRIEELEQEGVADRTIVIVTSDHGDGGLPRAKEYLYDSGLRVPFIMCIPPQFQLPELPAAGARIDRLCNFADFAPTVLSLAGLPVPDYMQGRALLGNQGRQEPEYVYATRDRGNTRYDTMRALRGKRWLYIRHLRPYLPFYVKIRGFEHNPAMQELRSLHAQGKLPPEAAYFMADKRPPEELFDTDNDPDNVHNLAADPRHARLLHELRATLKSEMARTGDVGFIPEGMLHTFREKAGTEWAVGHGERNLYDPVHAFQWMTMGQLEPFDPQKALEGMRSQDPVAQYWSATLTGYQDTPAGPETWQALLTLLDSEYGDIRAAAAFALIRRNLERTRSLQSLEQALTGHTPMWVRLNALNLIDDLDTATFEALKPTLQRIAQWSISFQQRMSPRRYVKELAEDLLQIHASPETAQDPETPPAREAQNHPTRNRSIEST